MRTIARFRAIDKFTEPDSHEDRFKHAEHPPSHEPAAAPSRLLSAPELRAPILQRFQRDYGNRASQHLVMRASSTELDSIPTGGGEPLPASSRAPLEQHFQADLQDVRVHTDSQAAESATNLDALAYTTGRDIYFAAGMYAPASSHGQRLLAHEVAHVVQQSSGKEPAIATKSSRGMKIGTPDDMLETEADETAEELMNGQPTACATEEDRKKPECSGSRVRMVQRQPAPAQSTTALDATAKSIIQGASDTTRDVGTRAVEAVWRIIHEYYSGKASNVNSVSWDPAEKGLATGPYPASNPTQGRIIVGNNFLTGVQSASSFAHRVLQVGHELEHIDQFRDPALGPGADKKDEREFLAFYHEALAPPVPHTGRFQHTTRIAVIDQALGYYNCLASASEPDKKKYAPNQQELVARRSAEIADMTSKGYANVPANPPQAGCQRQ